MASRATPTAHSWAGASRALAGRVNRRARTAAVLRCMGSSLLVASLAAVLWRAFGHGLAIDDRVVVAGLLGLGVLVSLPRTLRAAGHAPAVADADAAWALDRLAGTKGRGLAAAAVSGPAASEAAHAGGGVAAPPQVRLLPPGGWLPLLGALLLFALAFLAPTREPDAPVATSSSTAATRPGGPGAAGSAPGDAAQAAEEEASALQAQAEAAARVRAALDLPPDGPLDPLEAARQAADPVRRRKAAEAAAGTPLADLLGKDEPSGESLARLLAKQADTRALASERRRAAAGARAGEDRLAIPPARRAVVERYLELID